MAVENFLTLVIIPQGAIMGRFAKIAIGVGLQWGSISWKHAKFIE